jgi:predicted amidohydrolase YtcJ
MRPPKLAAVSRRLAALGITHITDASPDPAAAHAVAAGVRDGSVVQHVQLCASELPHLDHARLAVGPIKIVAADHELPDFEDLVNRIQCAHDAQRPVAIHCVTRASLILALAALDQAGSRDGDRIEHAAVAGPSEASLMARLRVRVVTQPSLVARRGDDYTTDVEPCDLADLWPYASLLRSGVRVAASSDAPYGDPDPWLTMRAALSRRTRSGRILGSCESVETALVLKGFLSPLSDPGGTPRQVEVGAAASLVLLDRSIGEILADPQASSVRATLVDGALVAGEL